MKLLTLAFILAISILVYQNCADIRFESVQKESSAVQSSPSVESLGEEEPASLSGNTNGDGYEGKLTRYYDWAPPGECEANQSAVRGEIHHFAERYKVVMEDCEPVPARELSSDDIQETPDGIAYLGVDYQRTFPATCHDIYDGGGENPNGLYWLDPDGTGGNSAELTYCDMNFVSAGWGAWSEWSACSSDCGAGEQTRTRQCQIVSCDGSASEVRDCETACE